MKILSYVLASAVLTSLVAAQTQTLRGKVEDVQNTTNQFYLGGTSIRLTSSTLSLAQLVGQQLVMQVVDVSSGSTRTLDVKSATATTKMLDMGNLRFNRAESWQVNAKPGSKTAVAVMPTSMTGYLPLGQMGVLLLGTSPVILATGTVSNLGQFEFKFTMPSVQSLVGVSFTSQALVETSGALTLTNPDSKQVRAN